MDEIRKRRMKSYRDNELDLEGRVESMNTDGVSGHRGAEGPMKPN